MSELSHQSAQRLIHSSRLNEAERLALHGHLRHCAACREHAHMVGVLNQHFVLEPAAVRPSARFAEGYLETALRRSHRNQILKPLTTVAGLAAMILVVLAAWFIIHNNPLTTADAETEQELFDAVAAGDSVKVERLLAAVKNPNIRDEQGNALLPVAAMTGNLKVMQLLLDSGANVNSTMKPSGAGRTALMEAALNNRGEIIELLISKGADVNQRESESGYSALHYAAQFGAQEIMEILLDNGADPNLQAKNGWTPMHTTVRYGDFGAYGILQDYGADVDAVDREGLTPLMAAIAGGNSRADYMVRWLLYAGADPNKQDKNGNSALHHAAMMNLVEVIPDLLNYGALVTLKNNEGQTPADVAQYGTMKEKLRAAAADGAESGAIPLDKQLLDAVTAGDMTEVERLLRAGANPDAVDDEDSTTALYHATINNDRAMVELLINNGADVNKAGSAGYTALEIAGMNEYLEILEILLDRGADPNQRNVLWNDGTALHSVVNFSRLKAAQMLLDAGADVNMVTDSGMTPLISMIRIGKFGLNEVLPVAELLLDAGVDPNHQDAAGRSALHYAEYGEVIALLIERGANADLQDTEGETALHRAVRQQNSDAVAVLLEHGADVRLQDNQGRTPLDLAAPGTIEEMLRQALAKE